MSTNCVILQPSYIPWRGFFHQMQKADVFIFYDDVQFDRHGWRNRKKTNRNSHGIYEGWRMTQFVLIEQPGYVGIRFAAATSAARRHNDSQPEIVPQHAFDNKADPGVSLNGPRVAHMHRQPDF